MKNYLFFLITSLLSSITLAQLTQTNEPAIGDEFDMFVCDSFASNLSTTTGTNVIWDYTGLTPYTGRTKKIKMLDPATTIYGADFPSSTKAFYIDSLLTTYYSSSATERVSDGFVVHMPPYDTVLAKFTTDNEILMTYPFAFGNTNSDTQAGTVSTNFGSVAANGTINSTIDGIGRLDLPPNVQVNGVIRLKTEDEFTGTLPAPFGNVVVNRLIYEYYDLAVTKLPIFIHIKITLSNITTTISQQLVLSKYDGITASIADKDLVEFVMYPNPADDAFMVVGEFENADVSIFNPQGQKISSQVISGGEQLSVKDLTPGMYFVKVDVGGVSTVKNLSVY